MSEFSLEELLDQFDDLTARCEAEERQQREERAGRMRCRVAGRPLCDAIEVLRRSDELARSCGKQLDPAEHLPDIANGLREFCRTLNETGEVKWSRVDHEAILGHYGDGQPSEAEQLGYRMACNLVSQGLDGQPLEPALARIWNSPSRPYVFSWLQRLVA